MTFATLLTHSLTIRRFTTDGEDRYNNKDLEDLDEVDVMGRVDAVASDEELRDRTQATQRFMVFLPAGTLIDATSEIDWLDEGITLKVDGEPLRTDDSIGEHHLEVFAYRING